MSRRTTFAPGEYYHLYNRGIEKRDIFISKGDYTRFLTLLHLCNTRKPADLKLQGRTLEEVIQHKSTVPSSDMLVSICAYVLMPNHFHLLVREKEEGGISRFMQKLVTGYSMYFNARRERSGVLFQGKFKSTHVANDRYLKYLISYIHLNPVKLIEPTWKESGIKDKRRAEKYLDSFPYSSYLDYFNTKNPRIERVILVPEALPTYFRNNLEFKEMVSEWLNYSPD